MLRIFIRSIDRKRQIIYGEKITVTDRNRNRGLPYCLPLPQKQFRRRPETRRGKKLCSKGGDSVRRRRERKI